MVSLITKIRKIKKVIDLVEDQYSCKGCEHLSEFMDAVNEADWDYFCGHPKIIDSDDFNERFIGGSPVRPYWCPLPDKEPKPKPERAKRLLK